MARNILIGALATGCIDATTVYVVPELQATGDDDGSAGDAGSAADGPQEGADPVEGSSNEAAPDDASFDGTPLE